jgi:hypothetical protein
MIINNIDGRGNELKIGDVVKRRFRENNDEKGIVIGLEEGVNGCTIVKWQHKEFNSYMVTTDIYKIEVVK